jgi:hypothetical protein
MAESRFDRLARALGAGGSRRRLVGAFLAGTLAVRRARTAVAEDEESGTAIADASGGDGNAGRRRTTRLAPNPPSPPSPPSCRPTPRAEACQGRCNRTVADGCGGRVRCDCPAGQVCGPGDLCCPEARLCLPSNVCCAEGSVCAPGGGVCCAPERVCTVGGVLDACCSSPNICLDGVCGPPEDDDDDL